MAARVPNNTDMMPEEKNPVVTDDGDVSTKGTSEFADAAALGTQQEKAMSLGTAFRYYRKAAIWSIAICKYIVFNIT